MFEPPSFITDPEARKNYKRWLAGKASAHARRDMRRFQRVVSVKAYQQAIHEAVLACEGKDDYTGESLAWNLIRTYRNDEARGGRREHREKYQFLPTVDHEGFGTDAECFKICGWRTNDCKSHLSQKQLLQFCKLVLAHCDQRT